MTYNGKFVVTTRPKSMIGAPGPTSYANVSLPGFLESSPGIGVRKHYSYVIDDDVYVLDGNYFGSGGYYVLKAPTYDPTNLHKTGNVALYDAISHANGTLLEIGNNIYMFGPDGAPTKIFVAPRTCPESWSDTGATLPFSMGGAGAPMAIIGSTIYVFGDGSNGSGDETKIYTADISTPTVFVYSGFDLPDGRTGSGLAVTPTKIFLYGGNTGGIGSADILSADIGTPLVWTDTLSDLSSAYEVVDVYVSDNYVYLLGGYTGSTQSTCFRSPIADGITFSAVQALAEASTLHSIQEINGRVYLYGGVTAATVSIQEASVDDLDNNVASPWTETSRSLPNGRWGYASYVVDNTMYLYGGNNVASGLPTLGTIQSCSLNGETVTLDGYSSRSPTNFSTTQTSLVTPTAGWQCVRIDDTLWFFSGITGTSTFSPRVWSAPVSSPRVFTLEHATNAASSAFFKTFIYNGYIYGIGGDDSGNVIGNSVFKAPITNPAAVWTSSGSTFPTNISRYSLAVIGNYVYVFGGCTTIGAGLPGASSAVVYRSLLSELDNVGSANWVTVTSLATASADHVMTMSNGYLYLIGGTSTSYTSIGTIQACLISDLAGGISNFKSLGTFSPGATTIAGGNAVYSDGDFYILGGRVSTTGAATTTIHRTANRALIKTLGDVKESGEAVAALSLGTGNLNSYNSFMQTGNFPWLYARTT